jgi:hypothetical protein
VTTWIRPIAVALALSLALPSGAHHGATVFDRSKPIAVSGVVREFRWTSPHAWIYLEVPRAETGVGATQIDQWAFEGASISVMVRNGWKSNSLRAGDRVRVLAAPRKDGTHGGEFLSVTLTETGKVLHLGII